MKRKLRRNWYRRPVMSNSTVQFMRANHTYRHGKPLTIKLLSKQLGVLLRMISTQVSKLLISVTLVPRDLVTTKRECNQSTSKVLAQVMIFSLLL